MCRLLIPVQCFVIPSVLFFSYSHNKMKTFNRTFDLILPNSDIVTLTSV